MENYEQRYKDALERAKECLQDGTITTIARDYILEIFPELQEQESEDEKIRKAIHIYLDWLDGRKAYEPKDIYSIKDMIAWLEKQSKDKKVSIWKHWKNGIAGNGEGRQVYLIRTGNTYNLSSVLSFECDYIELSELDNLMLEKQEEKVTNINREDYGIDGLYHAIRILEKTVGRVTGYQSDDGILEHKAAINAVKELYKKQGEKNPYSGVSFKYNGHIWGMCARDNGVDILLDKQLFKHLDIQDENKHIFNADDWYVSKVDGKIYNAKFIEKQGEKKSTDKVEPKFKVGDWITCKELNTARIINIEGDRYEVEFIDGSKGFPHIEWVDRNLHLWTIQDAKDGDVLVHNECPFIFMGIKDGIVQALEENLLEGTSPVNFGESKVDKDYQPSIKEQQELLFHKMKEAGYEWNSEKKELKKIEPKILDADKVIEWLKNTIKEKVENYGVYKETRLILPYNSIEDLINDFKEDFGLC